MSDSGMHLPAGPFLHGPIRGCGIEVDGAGVWVGRGEGEGEGAGAGAASTVTVSLRSELVPPLVAVSPGPRLIPIWTVLVPLQPLTAGGLAVRARVEPGQVYPLQ